MQIQKAFPIFANSSIGQIKFRIVRMFLLINKRTLIHKMWYKPWNLQAKNRYTDKRQNDKRQNDKRQKGQTSEATNVRKDKRQKRQTSEGTNVGKTSEKNVRKTLENHNIIYTINMD